MVRKHLIGGFRIHLHKGGGAGFRLEDTNTKTRRGNANRELTDGWSFEERINKNERGVEERYRRGGALLIGLCGEKLIGTSVLF